MPPEQLVAHGEREVERDARDDKWIDESFVQGHDDVFLTGIDTIEAGHRDADSQRPDHDRGPKAFEMMKEATPAEASGSNEHPPEGSDEHRGCCRQANPGCKIADAPGAARERNRVSRFVGHRNENGLSVRSIPVGVTARAWQRAVRLRAVGGVARRDDLDVVGSALTAAIVETVRG